MKKNVRLGFAIVGGLLLGGYSVLQTSADDFTTDFEAGYLRGWTRTGTAFDAQPTLGDNPTARSRGQASNHRGKWWIGGYENYQGLPGQKPGDIQGDGLTGTLTSAQFRILAPRIQFLVGGGNHPLNDPGGVTAVNLEVNSSVVRSATGNNGETLQLTEWDVSGFVGQVATLKIIDTHTGSWGHINCDDFQMLDAAGRRLPFSADPVPADRPASSVRALPSGPDLSTSSFPFVAVTDGNPPVRTPWSALSAGILTADHADLKITFSAEIEAIGPGRVALRAVVDDEVASPSDVVVVSGAGFTGVRSFTFVKPNLAAGGHWVEIQWKTDAGTTAYIGDASLALFSTSALDPTAQLLVKAAPSGPSVELAPGTSSMVPDMTGSLVTTATCDLAVTFTAEAYTGAGTSLFLWAMVDGVAASPSDVQFVSEGFKGVRAFTFVKQNVPAGLHQVAIECGVSGTQRGYFGDRTLTVLAAPELTRHGGLTVKAAPSGPDTVTQSTSWTDVPEGAASIATAANTSLEITFSSELSTGPGGRVSLRALVDGQPAEPSDVIFTVGENPGTRSFTFTKAQLGPGPHEVRMQWRVDTGQAGSMGDHTVVLNYWRATVPDLTKEWFELKPISGTRKVLAILWDPHRPDHPAPARDAVETMLFGARPSVADYFKENSGGRMQLESAGVLGWYDAALPSSYYWGPADPSDSNHDGWINPHTQKWAEAIRAADPYFNFAAYDLNQDHYLSTNELAILIVIPQNGPFGTMNFAVGREVPRQDLVVDGVKIDWISEAYIGAPPSLGVAAHELAHLLLGAGDMYFSGFQPYAAGPYSLMDQSPDNPGHLDALHKLRLGWANPRIVSTTGSFRLGNIEASGNVLLLYNPDRRVDEYFLVENRWRADSYDAALPYSGLGVWHIMEDPAVFNNLPVPQKVNATDWTSPRWSGWARRGIQMIRPIYGPPFNVALWDGSKAATGYDLLSTDFNPDHVTLTWADGTPSGFALECIPAPNPDVFVNVSTIASPTSAAGPTISIQRAGMDFQIRWPVGLGCFGLETADRLTASTVWTPVTALSTIVEDQMVVTLPVTPVNRFYRLRKP